jgi:hypothetical protein
MAQAVVADAEASEHGCGGRLAYADELNALQKIAQDRPLESREVRSDRLAREHGRNTIRARDAEDRRTPIGEMRPLGIDVPAAGDDERIRLTNGRRCVVQVVDLGEPSARGAVGGHVQRALEGENRAGLVPAVVAGEWVRGEAILSRSRSRVTRQRCDLGIGPACPQLRERNLEHGIVPDVTDADVTHQDDTHPTLP